MPEQKRPAGGGQRRPTQGQPQGRQPQPRQRARQRPRPPRPGPPQRNYAPVYLDPPIRNSPPMLSALVGGIGIVALIGILVFSLGSKSGGSGSGSDKADNGKLPNVSVAGAIECKINNSAIINLNTEERVKACASAKVYAKQLLVKKHGNAEGERQFGCLDKLWDHESDWSAWAKNPTSDAYGIAQILPDSHGTPVGMGDWKGQVDWGLRYIWGRYKTSCNAWEFWQCTSSCARYPGGPINKLGGRGDPQTTWY